MGTASNDLDEAQRFYAECMDAMHSQRRQIEEDLRFSSPSDPQQWDEKIKAERENDPGGRRPCLVLDQLNQYTSQVTGQIEKQPPSLHAIPISGGAVKEAAEQIDGRFRHIESASRAVQHYARSQTSATRAGVGYLIVRPEYVDRALNWQEPRISSEADPLKVVFDPWSVETDGSDATVAWLLSDVSDREWDRRWRGKTKRSFGDFESTKRDDDRKSTLVAEEWLRDEKSVDVVIYIDENGQEQTADTTVEEFQAQMQASGLPWQIRGTYKDKRASILWRRMSGCDVLETSEYPADSIGVVPVYGYLEWVDGRMRYSGIPRRGRMAQQAYNYHKSELMMPGAQLLASKRAVGGVEDLWDRAHVERRAFLPYNDFDENGAINAPTLVKVGSALIDHIAGAESALRDIQAAIGMYQANLGAPSNETSGVAIDARKEQGESSTAHFPSHMAASLGQVGNIVMQMDARLADTRRKQPILGVDGSAGSVHVDPEQQQAFIRLPDGGGVSINPNVGKYGVRVVVGASFSTQRSQTNAAFAEIMRGNKELAPTVAPFWAQTLDFPGSDKFAQAMASMAPPPVKAILQPEGSENAPDPAALAQELDQCKQALQEAIQHAKDAQDDADKATRDLADKQEADEVARYNAETARLKVTGANEEQIQAVVQQLINEMLSSEAELPGDRGTPTPHPVVQEMLNHHAQSNQQMAQLMQNLVSSVSKPRTRIPVRDKAGNITHVIDAPEPDMPAQQ